MRTSLSEFAADLPFTGFFVDGRLALLRVFDFAIIHPRELDRNTPFLLPCGRVERIMRANSPHEVPMPTQDVSRRQFAAGLGAAFALATARAPFAFRGMQHNRPPRPAGMVLLNSNENPYGPSPKAAAAITDSEAVAMRYPDEAYEVLEKDLMRLHGVDAGHVILGCGSTEILRAADMAFLGAEKNVVVAEPTFEAVLEYSRVTRANPIKVPLTVDGRHDLPRM